MPTYHLATIAAVVALVAFTAVQVYGSSRRIAAMQREIERIRAELEARADEVFDGMDDSVEN